MTSTVDALDQLAADLAIKDLAVRYSVAVDDRDLPVVLDSFTASGSFERAGQVVRGQDDLRSFFSGMMDRYVLTRHLVEMHIVDPREHVDRASGTQHGSAELVLGDTLYRAAYRYRDRYEREEGRWRFASRQLRFVYFLPAAELIDGVPTHDRVRLPGHDTRPSEHLD